MATAIKTTTITYQGKEIRTVTAKSGTKLYKLKDVCKAIGIKHITPIRKRTSPADLAMLPIKLDNNSTQKTFFTTLAGVKQAFEKSITEGSAAFVAWLEKQEQPTIQITEAPAVPTAPQSYKDALLSLIHQEELKEQLNSEIVEKQQQLESQSHLVAFANKILASETAISIGDFAMIVSKRGRSIGQKRMFALLRGEGILKPDNTPYQKYMPYFEVIPVFNSNGTEVIYKTLVTPKGQVYLVNRLFVGQAV